MITVWMEVSRDRYALPVIVTESIRDLAKKCHVTENCIYSTVCHGRKGDLKNPRFVRVDLDESDPE